MLTVLKKCLVFLTPRQRWQWAGLIPLTVTVAVMEALGAAMVLWFIKLISARSRLAELPPIVRAMYQVLPGHDAFCSRFFESDHDAHVFTLLHVLVAPAP